MRISDWSSDVCSSDLLVGRDERVRESLEKLGVNPADFEIHNARVSPLVPEMVDRLYARLQRKGHLLRDCQRLVNQDRNVLDRKSTRLNSSHSCASRMQSSA